MRFIPYFSPSATDKYSAVPSSLSRQYRTWVALYALDANERPRAEILRINEVTEADLAEFEASWLQLRCRPGALPTRHDLPHVSPPAS